MAINKVEYGGNTLIDITDTTATPESVESGKVFYQADGTRAIGTGATDTGWKNLTTSSGTWSYLRYRAIGKIVYVEGYASSLKYSGSSLTIVNTTNAIPSAYRPPNIKYVLGSVSGSRLARFWINDNGTIGLDWTINVSNGSNYTTAAWHSFNTMYMID